MVTADRGVRRVRRRFGHLAAIVTIANQQFGSEQRKRVEQTANMVQTPIILKDIPTKRDS